MNYKVIKAFKGGRKNKSYAVGDEVSSDDFAKGKAENRVKGNFLKPVEQKMPTVSEMKDFLKKKKVSFKSSAKKAELYTIWKKYN